MNTTAMVVCRAFLQKHTPQKQFALLVKLTPKEIEAFEHFPETEGDPTLGFESIEEQLHAIHFSWFTLFLRTLSENEIRLFLSLLTEEQAKGLKKLLGLANQLPSLNKIAKDYLGKILLKAVKNGKEILPTVCLPKSPMNVLLDLKYEDFLFLVTLLGLHDLAIELRYVIETSKLKQIHAGLSQEEEDYLKSLGAHKEALAFKRMALDQWDGGSEYLRGLLEQRGLNRIAKALYDEEKSLLWKVAMHLDIEKAEQLQKLCTPIDHPKAGQVLKEQVLETISYIQMRKGNS